MGCGAEGLSRLLNTRRRAARAGCKVILTGRELRAPKARSKSQPRRARIEDRQAQMHGRRGARRGPLGWARTGKPSSRGPSWSTMALRERSQQPNAPFRSREGVKMGLGSALSRISKCLPRKILCSRRVGLAKKSGWGIERWPCATNISPPNSAKATAVGSKERPPRVAPAAPSRVRRGRQDAMPAGATAPAVTRAL